MSQRAVIRAVCISERKGMQKHPVDSVVLRPHHGIEGDAHAGDWHRQVSLLAKESVDRMQAKVAVPLLPGAFAENILFCLLFFVLIPAVIYYVSYWYYGTAKGMHGLGMLFSKAYFRIVLDNQRYMFGYHAGLEATHPYSSFWWQWVLNIRPILYYLHYFPDGRESSIGAWLNPMLCWSGLCAMLAMTTAFGAQAVKPADPVLVDTSLSAGAVVDSSTPYNATYPASKAFDGKWESMYDNTTYSSDCWIAKMTNGYPVAYVVYKFNTATVVDGLRIRNSKDHRLVP